MNVLHTTWLKMFAREFVAALGALSLILLSIAHQPIGVGSLEAYRLADGSMPVICGFDADPNEGAILPNGCDVCRLAGDLDFPVLACKIEIAFWSRQIAIARPNIIAISTPFTLRAQFPRAPPMQV